MKDSVKNNRHTITLNPPLFLAIGFFVLIFTGALLLNLPMVTRSGKSIGFINALFTAGSASCVTGLAVVHTANTFNLAGQIILLLLIQIGGLGIMTLASLVPLILGYKINIKSRQILREQLNVDSMSGIVRLLRYVLFFTLSVELIGALLLSIRFIPLWGPLKGIWFSIFHSVSAFCNAGFDLIGDSVFPLRADWLVCLSIMSLVVIGGLGFFVTQELLFHDRHSKLRIHTKIVLWVSGILIVGGALGFLILEYTNPETIATEDLAVKINQSFFQSVIARTAGFYSVPISGLRDSTSFLLIILMFIGGSPGSTAGGLKTTTFGVLILTTISTIKGENEPRVFKGHIPSGTIKKALALVIVSLALIIIVSFLLTISESAKFIDLVFETVSAYATVGLSRGITSGLSTVGKLLITLTMYLGRIGPLTLGFAITNRQRQSNVRYPEANISVG